MFSFKGDTYVGLDAETLNDKEIFEVCANHLRILSGLYGVLALDLLMPYRLNGDQIPNSQGENLYKFWGINFHLI